ncbi:hypothetical protein NN561_020345 [Cricetulus griseus]
MRRREGRQVEMGKEWRWRKGRVERGKQRWREGAEKEEREVEREDFEFSPRNWGECSLAAHSSEERALGNKRRP